MRIPGICSPNIKRAATEAPPMVARGVLRLRLTDRLIKSPETNPNGTRRKEISRNETDLGMSKYISWLRASQEIIPRNVRPTATVIDLM